MKETNISISGFEAIFNACMKVNYITVVNIDADDNMIATRYYKDALMIIRAFDYKDDKEFTDVDEAYSFFSLYDGKCRVMDVNGTIYLDVYK